MQRKTILILMIPIMILTALSAAAESEPAPDYTTGTPWLYVDLIGNVTEETETNLKDNFALAVNKEALLKLEIPEGMPANGTAESTFFQAREDIAKMFTEGTAASRDAQLAFDLYALMTDWDSRNALGAAPLKEDTDALERITSVDELNRYFTEVPFEHQMPAPWDCSAEEDSWNERKWVINIGWTDLLKEDSAEYANETLPGKNRREAKTALAKNVLIKLGYSAAEADGKIEDCIAFENMLAPSVFTGEEQSLIGFYSRINNPLTREELAEAGGRLPLFGYIEKACGYPEFDRFNVLCPENLSALSRLYTDENLELIKSYMIVHGVIDRAGYLDRECYELKYISDHIDYGDVTIPDDAEASVEYLESQLPWAVSRLYTETYLHREDKERLTGLLEKMIVVYHQIIEDAEFLSDETRAKAIDKLESIDLQVLYPDDWTPYAYTGLEIKSAADGGTLYDAAAAIMKYRQQEKAASFGKEPDRSKWKGVFPHSPNCMYGGNNRVYVTGAFAKGKIYSSDMSDEEVLAKIGFFMGHEITHAFDRAGAMTDKNGNRVQWWTDDEIKLFLEKNQKLADYFSAIHPWEGISWNGDTKTAEACADMGGMKCLLLMAKDIEGFDYDRFFRYFADGQLLKLTPEFAMSSKIPDVHPLNYLRINTTLQQFDEFLDFYGIREGDGMYLAPEDRVNIW